MSEPPARWPGELRPVEVTWILRALLWSPDRGAETLGPNGAGILYCPRCGARFAEQIVPAIRVSADVADATVSAEKSIGRLVFLDAGFVNARHRHAHGCAWFKRGPEPSRRSPKLRPPAVVTCRCGQDIFVGGAAENEREYATADSESRRQLLQDEVRDVDLVDVLGEHRVYLEDMP